MTEAQRAAVRILETTPPDRVRRHEWQPPNANKGGRVPIAETRRLNAQILKMRADGYKQVEIARELGVTQITVSRHCRGHIKTI